MPWFRFSDMHSGGSLKQKWSYIYIEAESEDIATSKFIEFFGNDPNNVTCDCCGPDYFIDDCEDPFLNEPGLVIPNNMEAEAWHIRSSENEFLLPDEKLKLSLKTDVGT